MIIDCHGHYTTEPPAFMAFRQAQIAHFDDPSQPAPPVLDRRVVRVTGCIHHCPGQKPPIGAAKRPAVRPYKTAPRNPGLRWEFLKGRLIARARARAGPGSLPQRMSLPNTLCSVASAHASYFAGHLLS